MHLPEWLTKLLKDAPEREGPNDRDYELDQAAIDARLACYRGKLYPEIPADPRVLEPMRLAALRDRLLNKYAYRWRQVEAANEIIDALFEPIIQSDGTHYGLTTSSVFVDEKGQSQFRIFDPEKHKKYFYITVHSYRLGSFLTSYEDAARLLTNVLPDWGFTARVKPNGTEIRLECGDRYENWTGGATIATLIVVGMLDLLSRHPQEAKPWRSL